MQGTFQVELPLHSLFESPAVADLAVTITQKQAEKVEQADPADILAELEGVSNERTQRGLADEDESA